MTRLRTEEIYEAALDADSLGRFPGLLSKACHGRAAVVSWTSLDGDVHVLDYDGFDAGMMQAYAATFHAHDPWAAAVLAPRNRDKMVLGHEIVSDQSYMNSFFYNDFIRGHGEAVFHALGGSQTSRFGNALIGVYRDLGQSPFGQNDLTLLNSLARHLRPALILRGRLAVERHASRAAHAAWDSVNLASVIVGRNGRVVQHNAMADAVFRRGDALKVARNVLSAVGDDNRARLAKAIRLATAPLEPAGSSLMLVGVDGETYLVSIVPISRGAGPSVALVTFKDPLAPQDTLKGQLRSIWKLTAHEAFVAAELAQGRSIAEIAGRKSVLESTVKTQLKAIYGKLAVHGQPELIAKMRMLP